MVPVELGLWLRFLAQIWTSLGDGVWFVVLLHGSSLGSSEVMFGCSFLKGDVWLW